MAIYLEKLYIHVLFYTNSCMFCLHHNGVNIGSDHQVVIMKLSLFCLLICMPVDHLHQLSIAEVKPILRMFCLHTR